MEAAHVEDDPRPTGRAGAVDAALMLVRAHQRVRGEPLHGLQQLLGLDLRVSVVPETSAPATQ
jgi:hypothetical protein